MFPPLNPLRVFSVAAKLGSFTRAAEELNVSQSAVSRQVGVLEGYLGVRLFTRERDGVALTDAAASYHAAIAPALDAIEAATGELAREKADKPLRIRVYTTFAAKWLLGRMLKFQAKYPHIQLQLSHSVKPVDFLRDPVDFAIQLGSGTWPGVKSELLLKDVLQPVCSPRLLNSGPPLREIDDLKHYRLLYARYRRQDWRDWLAAVGSPIELTGDRQTVFDSSVLAYQAAIEGMGIVIGQVNLLQADLAAGVLVPLFDRPVERSLGYYAVWPSDRALGRNLTAFLVWLRQEAAEGA
jgi:LysR family glycine cleavage system transcriptional activator